jgi:hypothetical protein
MVSTQVSPEADGMEKRTFECLKCHHSETREMVADPLQSEDVTGWISGELGRPN